VLTMGALESRDDFTGIITSVPGLSGVSGSPLIDMDGDVVGMTYAGQPRTDQTSGGRPEPGPTDLHVYPMVPDSQGLHVPIEDALALKEEWT